MARKKGSDEGSVYYRSDRDKWMAQYYDVDPVTLESIKKRKSFDTKKEAKDYLKDIMYQNQNETYIEKHGITLKDLMTTILDNKYNSNMISEAQYERV